MNVREEELPGPPVDSGFMTEEQMQVLRWQISAYTAITRRLVEMHAAGILSQATSSRNDRGRQRWTAFTRNLLQTVDEQQIQDSIACDDGSNSGRGSTSGLQNVSLPAKRKVPESSQDISREKALGE